jgi:hypothetical protein
MVLTSFIRMEVHPMKNQVAFMTMLAYLWVMMIMLGSIVIETFMIYPNIFHSPPESLETALKFMAVRAPSDFFPPLGFLSWVTGAAALLLGWHVRSARYWIVGGILMMVCEGLVSMALFWPRNTIMFIEGPAVHSAAFLRQTAHEFQTLHWLRLGFNLVGSAFIFTGFLKFYRHRILTQHRLFARTMLQT